MPTNTKTSKPKTSQKLIAPEEIILNTLMGQRFNTWYNTGRFDSWITGEHPAGDPEAVTKEEILEDIRNLFKCE